MSLDLKNLEWFHAPAHNLFFQISHTHDYYDRSDLFSKSGSALRGRNAIFSIRAIEAFDRGFLINCLGEDLVELLP
jgi:hypothetical protein